MENKPQSIIVNNIKNVVFVCTGNTCRSPMAEIYFNFMVNDKDSKLKDKITATSCGLSASEESNMSKFAREVVNENIILENYNTDLFKSKRINELIIKKSFLVYGITKNHAEYITAMFPQYKYYDDEQKQLRIRHMPIEIDDPYAGDIKTYRNCFENIRKAVDIIIDELEL